MNSKWNHNYMCRKKNGWYNTFNVSRNTREGKIALSLWRDGKWIDVLCGTDIVAYDPDLVMQDTKGWATVSDSGALKLATTIVQGICENYRDAFKMACNVTDEDSEQHQKNLDARVKSLRKLIKSQYFCNLSMGIADCDTIINTLEKQAMEGTWLRKGRTRSSEELGNWRKRMKESRG